ncbi:TetR/AcrR family transcriptional regulator [Amycolatopsis sp. GM8]|uniref:TetR/AcrR family transcriptional regulator n=1 Tax=Amycolatopsis sp. GM8 TaxID=2896530 RepID=UPI001F452BF2|nr:TetR/AcrR family transcriptional regulator [Amycolatopsis sp. GM8]
MAGRPRKFVEDQALDAAMAVFWERGFEAATLAQLRAATGLSSASLYGAFGSKSGLFERAVTHYVMGPGQVTDLVADTRLSAAEALSQMLHASITMQSDPRHPLGCLVTLSATVGAASEESVAAREAAARRREADRSRIVECVRRGQHTGELGDRTRPEVIGALVHAFLLGISTELLDGVEASELHEAAEALIDGLRTERASAAKPRRRSRG